MISLASIEDLDIIMEIVAEAIEEMKKNNNPQWGSTDENYPNKEIFLNDIKNNSLYIIKENDEIQGFIAITDDNRAYDSLIKNSLKSSYILHRITIPKKFQKLGIASKLIKFAEIKALKNNIQVLKADTEISNVKMNNLFLKLGYKRKGTFTYDDYPGEYIYYEKNLGSEQNEI